ncbi:hypothetical protein PoB_000968100 [Plakobranchus ocellatus]|uniref:Uncharacterized protein n=1 Tax=Plakobranchus ocellatus TaxID=259542 RepID=A0AAV3YIV7_9GAST|nr:hypothetical protein PoB_000968100 [Plakobranchus ocellatus]
MPLKVKQPFSSILPFSASFRMPLPSVSCPSLLQSIQIERKSFSGTLYSAQILGRAKQLAGQPRFLTCTAKMIVKPLFCHPIRSRLRQYSLSQLVSNALLQNLPTKTVHLYTSEKLLS